VIRLALLAALALPGCAALVANDWHDAASHQALPPFHLVVSDADMQHACGDHRGYVFGCAVRIPSERVCLIYTRARPAVWILEHERKHCDGWDHHPTSAS
jgi:hypothetical protein